MNLAHRDLLLPIPWASYQRELPRVKIRLQPDMPKPIVTIRDILGPDGLMAKSLKGFEVRISQMQMALLLEEAIHEEAPVIVEAGTGTGKTFGYLVPIILSGKKAVISTGTKTLQEQVYFKDIPLLREAARLSIDAMIMKGRKNYLCLHKYDQFFSQTSLLRTGLGDMKGRLEPWLEKTEFADRAELPWLTDAEAFWDAVSATSDECLGGDCVFMADCYLNRLRARAAQARIIIVNHHLFFADMKVKQGGFAEIIPRFQVVVFDEAHSVEETATTFFGERLSTQQMLDFAKDVEKASEVLEGMDKGQLRRRLSTLRAASESLMGLFEKSEERARISRTIISFVGEGPGREISRSLGWIRENLKAGEVDNPTAISLSARADELIRSLKQIMEQGDANWLRWYEKRKRSMVFHVSPLDISERMTELIYDNIHTVAFTSATLSTNGTFDFFRSRLGLSQGAMEGIYPSHFDFNKQSLMYIPKDLPSPNEPRFAVTAAERIKEILERTGGRALVLFTSYHNLNVVYGILEEKIPYTVLRQGDAPRSLLLEEFRKDIHSVLMATGSFWQGVDVPGESLSCLIIDKLPFDSPADPLVAARIDAIRSRGGNPFTEYQVPSAIISLKQGLGRLIRKSSDKGILSILDTRVLTSRYGRFFLQSLPKIPITHELPDITNFMGNPLD